MERQNPDHNRHDPQRNDVHQQLQEVIQRYRAEVQQVHLDGNDQPEQAAEDELFRVVINVPDQQNNDNNPPNPNGIGRHEELRQLDLDAVEGLMRLRHISSERVNGLTPERIEKFEHFAADESLVGEQCIFALRI